MRIRKFKIDGLPKDTDFNVMSFGRQIDGLKMIKQFQAESKSTHLSQKRQTYQKAIKDAIKLLGITQYYCDFQAAVGSDFVHDDAFEFWYKQKW